MPPSGSETRHRLAIDIADLQPHSTAETARKVEGLIRNLINPMDGGIQNSVMCKSTRCVLARQDKPTAPIEI